MRFVNQQNNKIYSLAQIRSGVLKHVSMPQVIPPDFSLSEYGYELLIESPRPTAPEGFEVHEVDPIDNVQQWGLFPEAPEATANRQKEARFRAVIDEAKADPMVTTFAGMTHAQVADYIDTNVTDLASAKTFLKLVAKMMLIMVKKQYGG